MSGKEHGVVIARLAQEIIGADNRTHLLDLQAGDSGVPVILCCVSDRGANYNSIARLLFLGSKFGRVVRHIQTTSKSNAVKELQACISELSNDSQEPVIIHYGLCSLTQRLSEDNPVFPAMWNGVVIHHANVVACLLAGLNPNQALNNEAATFKSRRQAVSYGESYRKALETMIAEVEIPGYGLTNKMRFSLPPGVRTELSRLNPAQRKAAIEVLQESVTTALEDFLRKSVA